MQTVAIKCVYVEQVWTVQDRVWTINEALSQSQET